MNTILNRRNHFYIMHLNYANEGERTMQIRQQLWEYARENEIIGLNHNFVEGSWYDRDVRDTAIAMGLPSIWINQFNLFYNRMERHDIVVVLAGLDSILGVGRVNDEEATYDPTLEDFFPHIRHVDWIRNYEFGNRHMIPSVTGFVNTLHRVEQRTRRWRRLTAVRLH